MLESVTRSAVAGPPLQLHRLYSLVLIRDKNFVDELGKLLMLVSCEKRTGACVELVFFRVQLE